MCLSFLAGPAHGLARHPTQGMGAMDHELFAFFATNPNAQVGAVHMKAMPVNLDTSQSRGTGLIYIARL